MVTYALVPAGVGIGDEVAKWSQGVRLVVRDLDLLGRFRCSVHGRWLGLDRHGGGGGGGGSILWLGIQRANEEGALVLIEDALVVVLPELLGGVLAGDACEDLLATRVVVLELCQIVDVVVDNDVEVVALVVRRDVALCEGFGHVGGWCERWW